MKNWKFCLQNFAQYVQYHRGLVTMMLCDIGDLGQHVHALLQIMACCALLANGIKPLPELMLAHHQWGPLAFIPGQCFLEYSSYQSSSYVSLKFTPLKSDLYPPWVNVNKLTHWGLVTSYGIGDLGQHWFRQWLVAWRHQAITWTNVDFSSVRSCGIHLMKLS